MWILVLAFVAAQAADLLTWAAMDPTREANPIVVLLGPAVALSAKLGLLGLTAWWCWTNPNAATKAVLAFGAVIGILGAYTNL